jgi:autophagy-related protein 16
MNTLITLDHRTTTIRATAYNSNSAAPSPSAIMEDVYNLIQQRNSYETIPFLPIHAANFSLSNLADVLQTRCESLEKQYYLEQQQLLVEAHHQIEEAAQHDRHGGVHNNNNEPPSNTRLRVEVAQLHSGLKEKIKKELLLHSSTTMETRKELDLLQEEKSAQETIISSLKMELERSHEITTHLQSELENAKMITRLSEKQFDGLKDAIRQLQEENDEKTKLNERLVENAVAEKEKMAEQFNSMNEMVEKLQKEISMLRSYNNNMKSSDKGWFRLSNTTKENKKLSTAAASLEGSPPDDDDATTRSRKWGAFGAVLPSKPLYTIKAHREDASCVVYDGTNLNLVATASSDATVRVWDTSNGQLQATFSGGGSLHPMTGVDMSGGLVTACGADKTCRVWQYKTKRLLHQLAGHSQKITCVKLFPGETNIVTGSADRSIRIWDISRHIYTQTITFRHSSTANCVDVVGGVETQPVVTGHIDGGVCFWDVRSGDRVLDISTLHEGGVTTVQWKPGSSHQVLTCGRDSTLKIIDNRTQSVVQIFQNSALRILSNNARCSFSPDAAGKYIACGGGDNGDVFVFDAVTTDLTKRLSSAHQSGVVGLAWGKGGTNGQQIATVDKSGVLVLWA